MYNIPRNSSKAIKDIRVGDYVYSYDVESDTKELKKVTAVFVSEKDELYSIETSEGTVIDTTEGHPFYVEGKGWTVAAELKPEDILTTADGERVEVESITVIKLETPVKVYNLEVEDNHTYYVSADEVLVHNICGDEDAVGNRNKNAQEDEGDKVLGGSFEEVHASGGSDEVGHHIPQNAHNVNELGMTRNEGPALLMTKEDHAKTRTYRGRGKQTMVTDKGLSSRQRMVLDIINIRENFGTKYNQGLLKMIKYAKTLSQFQK